MALLIESDIEFYLNCFELNCFELFELKCFVLDLCFLCFVQDFPPVK